LESDSRSYLSLKSLFCGSWCQTHAGKRKYDTHGKPHYLTGFHTVQPGKSGGLTDREGQKLPTQKEYMETIAFTIASKKIKYIEVNLTRMLMISTRRTIRKRLKKTTEGRKISHAHGLVEST
jgi:hypothetical protein